jgi:hypothetical protein
MTAPVLAEEAWERQQAKGVVVRLLLRPTFLVDASVKKSAASAAAAVAPQEATLKELECNLAPQVRRPKCTPESYLKVATAVVVAAAAPLAVERSREAWKRQPQLWLRPKLLLRLGARFGKLLW